MEWTLSARSGESIESGRDENAGTPSPASEDVGKTAFAGFQGVTPQAMVLVLIALAAAAHLFGSSADLLPLILTMLAALAAALVLIDADDRTKRVSPVVVLSEDTAPMPVRRATTMHTAPSLNEELAQAAAMAQLTQRISHELRTPLNAVIGFSELMSQETFGPLGSHRYRDYAEHIRECGQTLLKSTEDTLALTSSLADPSNSPAACRRPCDLTALLDDAVAAVALAARQESVRFDVSFPAETEIVGDRRVLRQILVNLLLEAISRSRFHGRIQIAARPLRETIILEVRVEEARNSNQEDTLALCVARALAELQSRRIDFDRAGGEGWRCALEFDLALQPDFFHAVPPKR